MSDFNKVEKIRKKLLYGDFYLLAKILDISSDAAKQRFNRGNPDALKIMERIIDDRNRLVSELQNTYSE